MFRVTVKLHLHALEEDVGPLRGALHVGMPWVHGQVMVLLHGVPVDEPRWCKGWIVGGWEGSVHVGIYDPLYIYIYIYY